VGWEGHTHDGKLWPARRIVLIRLPTPCFVALKYEFVLQVNLLRFF